MTQLKKARMVDKCDFYRHKEPSTAFDFYQISRESPNQNLDLQINAEWTRST